MTTPDIRLPAELIPSDGRFGSGPSKVRPEAVARLSDAARGYLGTSHRREGVRSVVRRARDGLRELFSLPDGYEVLLGNGGTTSFWDSASFCLIERRSQHLSFGEFSAKFAAVVAAAPHLDSPEVVESALGTHPEPHANPDVDAYALTHNETSTGVMMDIRRPDGTTADDGLVLVDATSGAAALRVDPAQFDVYYFAPQKALAAEGGLWFALCSPAAVERVERIAASGRWVPSSLDLHLALENSRLDQTYNTPALSSLFLATDTIEWIVANGGLEWAADRCDRSAEALYGWAEASPFATPFVAKPSERSHSVATIDFEGVDAAAIAATLRANGIVDTEPYRKLGRNQLRIAMFPAIEPDDLAILTRAIDFVVERLGDSPGGPAA
ncbi:MAG TPA: phosphoserine transaminase [Acidimicrobiia bacterium]|nr:phosphoserine transaminase [Acidimicrobiia bacterium]